VPNVKVTKISSKISTDSRWKIGLVVVIALTAIFVWKDLTTQRTGSENSNPEVLGAQTITYKGVDGKTTLDLLKKDHRVEYSDSSLGVFINSIDGVANSTESYWMYYVDGELGQLAPDKFMTKNNQTIEWKYEKIDNLNI